MGSGETAMKEIDGPEALTPVSCSRATHTALGAFLKEDRIKFTWGMAEP
jgi:hypothetical protein